jgi:hypothetical protein
MLTLPSLPVAVGTGFDASWIIGLNRAHAQGLVAEASALFRGDVTVRDALLWVQLESAAPAEFQEPIEIEWSSLRLADLPQAAEDMCRATPASSSRCGSITP